MGYLAYLVVAVLFNSWIIAFLGYGAGDTIHILLFLAFLVTALSVTKNKHLLKHERSALAHIRQQV